MTKLSSIIAVAALALGLGSCDSTALAYGDANSIIAVMRPELWEEVSEDVYSALEQTIRTVRNEKTFTVTYQDPSGDYWGDLRRFRQMLLIGTLADSWIQEALDGDNEDPSMTRLGIHQVGDVWARGQQVTVVLLPDDGGVGELTLHLAEVHELLDEQFRTYALNRMYMSGADTALADTLAIEAGFSLILPAVYRWNQSDSVFLFRNDNPDPSELIRQIGVTWKTPIPSAIQQETVLEWRSELVAGHYSEPQDHALENVSSGPIEHLGNNGYQVQAEWRNPPDRGWPAGGVFITRVIVCENQNRSYLLDSWLYAPGKEKYEYMIQLETILDSFRCGSA